ncbi:NAD(P)/FAD-dependent oxidoreductase [Rhizobium sp. SSA_523]|uniref:NAD(P)/FAD-dependent oxidoreductase n=1 Tax=Rhizobium sp. SSA_523 TaxID=2952477 RepID=UPI0020902AA8|nr:NAD(P)/FAD-dependent oxidoreductase [Rhizobium sp. SSA_523]MCO5733133.1 NAD(P)/FAD-dependent oxidoreductase [Rhizobium sp. SSA_523]WKC24007.1 NAD(P)/FAD-dependent oxidoreductase [Rhizobium sp. SSA_523]
MSETMFDVIIIGGSYAGLSAALQLGRARRRVLVIDEGLRRNRFAARSHGFLTQDGIDPAEIAAKARAQVLQYPTVSWLSGRAKSARPAENAVSPPGGFDVIANGVTHHGRRLILAFGVTDRLPEIEGLGERWGKSVFHCPYCHGYELDQGRIGVLAGSELSMHHALMLPDWGETTLLLNQAFEPDADQLAALAARGVAIERERVDAITGHADIRLADGRSLSFSGLFALARIDIANGLPQQLGLDMESGPLGAIIKTDPMKETSRQGIFACGDAARPMASLALAVGDGNLAGAAAHRSLLLDAPLAASAR